MKRFAGFFGRAFAGAVDGTFASVIATAFGRSAPRREASLRREYAARVAPVRRSQLVFFVATFSMLSKLSEVDGYVSPAELRAIDRLMNGELGLDRTSRDAAARIFNAARSSPQTFEDFALQFYREFHERRVLLMIMVDILVAVAAADGTIGEREESMIRSAVSIFDIAETEYQVIVGRHSRQIDRYYHILNSERGDPIEVIKKRYRRLASEYHPDRVASKGLPEEFGRYASEKFREIQEAYERVRVERGL